MSHPESTIVTTAIDLSTITWNTSNVTASQDNQVLTSDNLSGYVNNASYQITTAENPDRPCFIEFQFDSTVGFQYIGLTESFDVQTSYAQYSAGNIYGLKKEYNYTLPCVNGLEVQPQLGNTESIYTILYDGANVHIFKDKVLIHSISKTFTGPIYAATTMYGGYGGPISISKLKVGTYTGNQFSGTSVSVSLSSSWVGQQLMLTGVVSGYQNESLTVNNTAVTVTDGSFSTPIDTQTVNVYASNGNEGIVYLVGTYQLEPLIISKNFDTNTNTFTIVTPKLSDVTRYILYDNSRLQTLGDSTSSTWTDAGSTVTLSFYLPAQNGKGFLKSTTGTVDSPYTSILISYPQPSTATVTGSGSIDGFGNTTLTVGLTGSCDGIFVASSQLATFFGQQPIYFLSSMHASNVLIYDITDLNQLPTLSFPNTTTTIYLYPYNKNDIAITFVENSATVQLTPPPVNIPYAAFTLGIDNVVISYGSVPANYSVYLTSTLPDGKQEGDTLDSVPSDATLIIDSLSSDRGFTSYQLTGLIADTVYQYCIVWSGSEIKLQQITIFRTFKSVDSVTPIVVTNQSISSGTVTLTYTTYGNTTDRILVTSQPLSNVTITTSTVTDLTTIGSKRNRQSILLADEVFSSYVTFSGGDGRTYYLYPYNSNIAGLSFGPPSAVTIGTSSTTTALFQLDFGATNSGDTVTINIASGLSYTVGDSITLTDVSTSNTISGTVTDYSQALGDGEGQPPYSNLTFTVTSIVGQVSGNKFYSVSLGGSGGGGNGGNNGGNGHNNMATLTYNLAKSADLSYAESVVVYGETAVTRPDYTDTLAVSVPVSQLNQVLSFSKDGEAAASGFTVDLTPIAAAVKTALEAKLGTDHALPSLSSMGIDARSILSHTPGAWAAADGTLKDTDSNSDTARNVYEQAADKGKLSTSAGQLDLASGDTFVFYLDSTATQSLTITIDDAQLEDATASDVAPLIPFASIFGASNAEGQKGTISKSWTYKFTVTVTAA